MQHNTYHGFIFEELTFSRSQQHLFAAGAVNKKTRFRQTKYVAGQGEYNKFQQMKRR